MNKIDMHFHSTKSDGDTTTGKILEYASNKKLEFLALTDHDIVSKGFRDEASQIGIQTCESVEISARNYDDEKSLHLTFYANTISRDVEDILSSIKVARRELIYKQVKHLASKGFKIDVDEFYESILNTGRNMDGINKFDIIMYIFQDADNRELAYKINGGKTSYIDFYQKYMKRGGEGYSEYGVEIEEYEPSIEVCSAVKESNDAILSIAHPNFTFKGGVEEFKERLPGYIEKGGINALELNSMATREWCDAIISQADKYGLYLTFGSDCHRIGKSDEKHADIGELNANISPDFIAREFSRYKEKLI